ncbi:MAG: energy-coupling factor ABC transporter ATP-binding protein [bacterium]
MEPVIQIKDLSFRYENGVEAISKINLEVHKGETVVLIGANGAGKSTLLLLMRGILGDLDGRTMIAGKILDSKKKVEEIAAEVGLVFQNPDDQLFCPSVFDDVAFGPINMGLSREEVGDRVRMALAAVGLTGYERRVPHQLSDGEKKRVSLATIYAMKPRILLLDEPTSHLDPSARLDVVRLIEEFDGTRVIATHDFEFILKAATRVILMSRGEIKADGLPVEILTNETLLRENGMEMPLVVRYLMALQSGDHEALHEHEHEHIYHYHTQDGVSERRVIRHSHPHDHTDTKWPIHESGE